MPLDPIREIKDSVHGIQISFDIFRLRLVLQILDRFFTSVPPNAMMRIKLSGGLGPWYSDFLANIEQKEIYFPENQ